MATTLFQTKSRVAAQLLSRTIAYLEKDPEANFPTLLNFVKTITLLEKHKEQIEQLARVYRENAAVSCYVNRLLREVHPHVKKRLILNWFIHQILLGSFLRESKTAALGVHVPDFLLVDPTSACNLNCRGCWAGRYSPRNSLSFERLDKLFSEAKELGIYWIVLSGGEPLVYPRLFELMARHSDMAFMAYTNGTLIDEKTAGRIIEVGNFSPAISLEGWQETTDARRGAGTFARVMHTMDLLRARGAVFGASLTITRHNVREVTSDEFIDFLIERGVAYVWTFHYIPIGRNPDVELMITPEQRAYLARRIPYLRTHKPIQIADFWNDGELVEGCIAGGRKYIHINAQGEVEPCAFVHFAVDNINEKSLQEVLKSSLFEAYQKRQPFHCNHLRPCPIIDNPRALREIVQESGAHPTHEGAETVLEGVVAAYLDDLSRAWGELADEIWAERQKVNGKALVNAAG